MSQIRRSLLYLGFLITLLTMIPRSTSDQDYWWSVCSNGTMFTNNSQYQTNLNTLLHSLSSNATANSIGFYSTSVANGTNDAVYGNFLCQGDLDARSCSECVETATTKDLPKTYCPNRKVAVIWYAYCMVRYSNESLFGRMDDYPKVYFVNTQTGNSSRFKNNVADSLYNLGDDAANDPSGKKFATKTVTFSSSPKPIYCLAQCTPDLTASDCKTCLQAALVMLEHGPRGARVVTPSCYLRYEIYAFYGDAVSYLSPAPSRSSPLPASPARGCECN